MRRLPVRGLARSLTVGVLVLAASPPAPAADALFAPGAFASLPFGAALVYRHRQVAPAAGTNAAVDATGTIRLTHAPTPAGTAGPAVTLTFAGTRQHALGPLPAADGHPLLVYFLERVKGVVARTTGGSPFYIQKLMRAALAGPGVARAVTRRFGDLSLVARELVFHPFRDGRHRRRLGVFANLELRFVLADGLPGRFLSFTAHAAHAGGTATAAFVDAVTFETFVKGE